VNAATITALCTGVVSIIVATTALVKVLMHIRQPPAAKP